MDYSGVIDVDEFVPKKKIDDVIDVDTYVPPAKEMPLAVAKPCSIPDVEYAKKEGEMTLPHPEPTSPCSPRGIHARLHWEDVRVTAQNGDKEASILDGVWGESPQGEVSAIMGPSGSGKTSLLNVLCGRLSNATANFSVQAQSVTWNGRPLDVTDLATRQTIAFVAQDDSLPVTATPREAILFSARLRLDKNLTLQELEDITENMLKQLHLGSCANTLVGGALLKGISGGERKRTSVGVELVTKPKLVFLDEPTSGLDSFNALELVQVLKQVAASGAAVMLTIHQPSSEIWNLFDRLTLLKKGRVMYEGRRELVNEKFASCGYPLPPNYNPADWVMFCAQSVKTEILEEAGFFPINDFSTHGKQEDAMTLKSTRSNSGDLDHCAAVSAEKRAGIMTQTEWLLKREIQHFKRNTHPLRTRTAMTIMIALMAGILFWQAAQASYTNFVNLQVAFGALLLSLMGSMFSTTLPALVAFPEERPVFLREYSTGSYGVVAYFLARFFMEVVVTAVQVTMSVVITYYMVGFNATFGQLWAATYVMALVSTALGAMIGSSVSDPGVAIELLPAVFMPQILFSGFFIPKGNMPDFISWLTYVFPLTYAMRIAMVYEFSECEGTAQTFCNALLENVEAEKDDVWWYWIVLVGQFLFFRLLAIVTLRFKAETFY